MAAAVVYISFTVLMWLLLIICSYFAVSIIYRNIYRHKLDKRLDRINPLFIEHMKRYNPGEPAASEIGEMKSLISDMTGLEAFNIAFHKYTQTYGYNDKLFEYTGRIIKYKTLLKIVRGKYRISYILYLISEYRIFDPDSIYLAVKSLTDKSYYTRINALLAVKNTGDTGLAIHALKITGRSALYFNSRIIVDFLDTFAGNKTEFRSALINQFDVLNYFVQRQIITHFNNQRDYAGLSLLED